LNIGGVGLPRERRNHFERHSAAGVASRYEDATSVVAVESLFTGPPPFWACPSSPGPIPAGSVGRPSLVGAAACPLPGGGADAPVTMTRAGRAIQRAAGGGEVPPRG